MKIFKEVSEGRLCPKCKAKGYEIELVADTNFDNYDGVEGYMDILLCEECGWEENWRFRSLKEAEELNFISGDN